LVDYDEHGRTYTRTRRPDPRIAARIDAALGDSRTVVNVGAGAGSYEPEGRWVLAVEPSATMRSQRPPGAVPAIAASAEALPLDDDSVDAAMASLTIHHWSSLETGLAEMRRVARGPVVVFTLDLDVRSAWYAEYFAEGIEIERPTFPSIEKVAGALGGDVRVESVPTPADCVDGFFEAFWNRPEQLLDPEVRASQSFWAVAGAEAEKRMIDRLASDLESGAWDVKHGHLRELTEFDGGLRLVISEP
jgi:SAM-dependent methyltransferase